MAAIARAVSVRPPSFSDRVVAVDTSRHDIEHMCSACEANQTGLWATLEVLAKHGADEITPAINAEIVALCVARGTVRGLRDAA